MQADGGIVKEVRQIFFALSKTLLGAFSLDELAETSGHGHHDFKQIIVDFLDAAREKLDHAENLVADVDRASERAAQPVFCR